MVAIGRNSTCMFGRLLASSVSLLGLPDASAAWAMASTAEPGSVPKKAAGRANEKRPARIAAPHGLRFVGWHHLRGSDADVARADSPSIIPHRRFWFPRLLCLVQGMQWNHSTRRHHFHYRPSLGR